MILLIDIGNSRIKWAMLGAGGISAQQAASYDGWSRESFDDKILSANSKPERILVSNVGGDSIAQLLTNWARESCSISPEFVLAAERTAGVRSAYAIPEQLGVDRWLGIIAAFHMHRSAVCVASVGTAMTVDGVDASGQHLGGVIVPGPDLAVSSLLTSTSDLAARSKTGDVKLDLFADNTLGAIHQGVAHMLAGVIEKSVNEIHHRIGAAPTLLLTGGACDRIAPLLKTRHATVPDLVLQGLAILASP